MIVRPVRGALLLHEPLANSGLLQLHDAVVDEGVVAATPQRAMSRPGASGPALVCVVTGPAVAPELPGVPIAREADRLGVLPDLLEAQLPDVASRVRGRR